MVMKQELMTVMAAMAEYLCHCSFERKLDEKTISAYRVDLEQFARVIGIDSSLQEITRERMKEWLRRMAYYKPRTVKRKVASITSFLRYLECSYDYFENPFRRMRVKIKRPKQLPRVMTGEEVKRMLVCLENAARLAAHGSQKGRVCVRNWAVIELLFCTGMRIGELCDLKNEDIDLTEGRVRIHGKGNKERIVDICPAEALTALQEWLKIRSLGSRAEDAVFTNRLGNGLSAQSVRAMVHSLARKCNIDKNVTPHMFRHTFASLLLEEDVDVAYIQQILGHSSIATTQIYLHVNPRRQREVLMNHHPRSRLIV